MNNFPFFKKIAFSFFSKEMYAHVGLKEINKSGLKYLFFLIVICWIPQIVKMQIEITNSINNDLPAYVDKFPVITITNGVASFDKPCPYTLKDDTGNDIVIFDNTGEFTSLEGTSAQILMTESKVIYKKSALETREYDLSNINDFTLTHEMILSWAKLGNFLGLFCFLVIVPLAFLYRAVVALVYALIGLIINASLQTKYSFQTIYRLGIVAMTPAYIVDKLFGLIGFDFPGWSLLCFAGSIAYLYFAMKSTKDAEAQNLASTEFGANNGSGNSGI